MTTARHGPKLLILGKQGSGKGTQGARLAAHLGVRHLATGDMLRAAVHAGTPLGREVATVLAAGELVSDELMLDVLDARLNTPDVIWHGFLLDGFPRTLAQAESLLERLGPDGIDAAVELELATEIAVERLLARAREDDRPEAIARRLALYERQTVPVSALFDRLDVLLRVDGNGTPDEVFDRVRGVLDPVLWGTDSAVG